MNTIDYLYSKDRVLDFSSCKYLGEVHEIIKTEWLKRWKISSSQNNAGIM